MYPFWMKKVACGPLNWLDQGKAMISASMTEQRWLHLHAVFNAE
jgi:hypothetical protein